MMRSCNSLETRVDMACKKKVARIDPAFRSALLLPPPCRFFLFSYPLSHFSSPPHWLVQRCFIRPGPLSGGADVFMTTAFVFLSGRACFSLALRLSLRDGRCLR